MSVSTNAIICFGVELDEGFVTEKTLKMLEEFERVQ